MVNFWSLSKYRYKPLWREEAEQKRLKEVTEKIAKDLKHMVEKVEQVVEGGESVDRVVPAASQVGGGKVEAGT